MPGSSKVVYGDLSLYHINTQELAQTQVLDPSGTDLLCYRYVLRVQGLIHGFATWCQRHSIAGVSVTPLGSAGRQHQAIRVQLPPRKEFSYYTGIDPATSPNGTLVLYAKPFPEKDAPEDPDPANITDLDVKDGPYCTAFNAVRFGSDDVWAIDATFEVHKVECDTSLSASGNTKGVLSNRWSVTDSIDRDRRTTRTYTGTLILASSTYNIQSFRSLCLPTLQPYLRRESMQFVASEDGRSLRYSIVDVETAVSAPYPLTSWEIVHDESIDNAMTSSAQIGITMTGDTQVDRERMLSIGFWVFYGMLLGRNPPPAGPVVDDFILDKLQVRMIHGDVNTMQFSAAIRRLPRNGDLFNAILQGVGRCVTPDILPPFTSPYDPFLSQDGRPGETPQYQGPVELIGIFQAYLQTPCDNDHYLNPAGVRTYTDGNDTPSNDNQIEYSAFVVPDLPPDVNTLTSDSHKADLYTYYRMESLPIQLNNVAVMPLAVVTGYTPGDPPPDTVKFINLAGATAFQKVRIHAERVGDYPELPDAEVLAGLLKKTAADIKVVSVKRLFGTPEPIAAMNNAGTQRFYRARYEVRFSMSRPPLPTEQIAVGKNVWIKKSSEPQTDGIIVTNTVATNSPWT